MDYTALVYIISSAIGIFSVGFTLTLVKLFQDGHFYLAAGAICTVGLCILFLGTGLFIKQENIKE